MAVKCFGDEVLLLEREGEGEQCVGRVRVDLNPTTKARFGLRVPAKALQHGSKMVPGVGELGIECRRLAKRGNRFFALSDLEESIAKVVVSAIIGGPEGNRL